MDENGAAVQSLIPTSSRRKRRAKRRQKSTLLKQAPFHNVKGFLFEHEIISPISFFWWPTEKWPKKHSMSVKCTDTAVMGMMEEIGGVDVGVNFEINWSALPGLREIVTKLAQRHSSAPYKHMAWYYASKGRTRRKTRSENPDSVTAPKRMCHSGTTDEESMLPVGDKDSLPLFLMHADKLGGVVEGNHCGVQQNNMHEALHTDILFQFLLSCIRHTVPGDIFGSYHNKSIFIERWLPVLLGVPGRKSVALGRLMEGVKVTEVSWADELGSISGRGKSAYVVSKVWLWLLNEYFARLLACHFVLVKISGGNSTGIQQAFFAKRVWQSWTESTLTAHTSAEGSNKTDPKASTRGWIVARISAEEQMALNESCSPQISTLQFRVKKHGVRPVMKVRFLDKDEVIKKTCQALLRCLIKDITGNDVISYLSKAWTKFYQLKNKILPGRNNEALKDVPRLFVVKVDVEDAYGSVNHEKICAILSEKVEQAGFKRDSQVSVKILKCFKKLPNSKYVYKERYELEGHPAKSVSGQDASTSKWSIKSRKYFQMGELLAFLNTCIRKQYVRERKQLYRLIRGLVQGSIFSPLLWDIYLNHLVAAHLLPHISDVGTELICGADDILLLTNSQEKAEWFLRRMKEGFEDYNVQINPSKISTNFKNSCVPEMDFIRFWGFLLDTRNFRVVADYGGPPKRNLIHTLNLRILKDPWKLLESFLLFGNTKLCFLTLNMDFSGRRVVLCNVYRAALILTTRFHAITKVIFNSLRIKVRGFKEKRRNAQSSATCGQSLSKSLMYQTNSESNGGSGRYKNNQLLLTEYIQRRVKYLNNHVTKLGKRYGFNNIPTRDETMWLTYEAFRTILGKNGGYYPFVLKKLSLLQKNLGMQMADEQISYLQGIVNLCQMHDC